jgi:hypothetical protein
VRYEDGDVEDLNKKEFEMTTKPALQVKTTLVFCAACDVAAAADVFTT